MCQNDIFLAISNMDALTMVFCENACFACHYFKENQNLYNSYSQKLKPLEKEIKEDHCPF